MKFWPCLTRLFFVIGICTEGVLKDKWCYNEELVTKTSYIHSYMLLIHSSGHSKEANFQHKITAKWKMSILIETWSKRYLQIQIPRL